jgi:hypothetical protein
MGELSQPKSGSRAPDQASHPETQSAPQAAEARTRGPAETLTREQYARQVRDRSPGQRGADARAQAAPDAPADAQQQGDRQLAEPRSRQEVGREARARTVRPHDRSVPDRRGTVAQSPAGRQDRGAPARGHPGDAGRPGAAGRPDGGGRPGGGTRQEHANGHDGSPRQVSVVRADRTIGDTTPAGIGRKPTGEQLRDMESDKLSRGDRFRKKVYERADDIQDSTEKTAGTLQGILGAHRPTGQDVKYTTQPAIDRPVPPGADASSIATAGLALGLVADRLIRRVRDMFRQPKG